jgi:hypothetical protein
VEGGRRKAEGGRRKAEGGRRKAEGGRRAWRPRRPGTGFGCGGGAMVGSSRLRRWTSGWGWASWSRRMRTSGGSLASAVRRLNALTPTAAGPDDQPVLMLRSFTTDVVRGGSGERTRQWVSDPLRGRRKRGGSGVEGGRCQMRRWREVGPHGRRGAGVIQVRDAGKVREVWDAEREGEMRACGRGKVREARLRRRGQGLNRVVRPAPMTGRRPRSRGASARRLD